MYKEISCSIVFSFFGYYKLIKSLLVRESIVFLYYEILYYLIYVFKCVVERFFNIV